MTSGETYQHYLADCIEILKAEYRSARQAAAASQVGDEQSFRQGEVFGLMRALSLLQQQAVTFGLPLADIYLADYDPEKELGSIE